MLNGTVRRLNERVYSEEGVIRVFISSTFRDMQLERDILVKKVFPGTTEDLCREREVTVTEVDLRWGIAVDESCRELNSATLPGRD